MHPAIVLAQILFMTLLIGMPLVGLLISRSQRNDGNTRIWFLAIVLDSLQIPLLASKASMPSWLTIAFPGAIPVMFFTALFVVLKRELTHDAKPSLGYIVFVGLIYTAISSLIFGTHSAPDITIQTFNNLVFIGFSLVLMYEAFSLARSVSSRGMYFVALGFAIGILGYGTRAWWHLVFGEITPVFDFTAVSNFQIWTACINLIFITFGYLGYAREKAESESARLLVQKVEAETRGEEADKYANELQRLVDERDQMVIVNSRFLNLSALAVFNTAIVHEISQPLQAVSLSLDNLRYHDQMSGGRLKSQIDEIIQINNKTCDIVSALRQMMVNGNSGLAEMTDVLGALRTVLPIIVGDARQRGISVNSNIPEGEIYCECNNVLFQRLIINLVANAFDAFATARTFKPELCIEVTERMINARPNVVFTVKDNGPGMEPEVMNSLFQPFNTKKPTGLGIGLSLADILLRKWSGRIYVREAKTSTGSEFEIVLPVTLNS